VAQDQSGSKSPRQSSGLGERIRAFDWAATDTGALDDWPKSLITALDIMLGSNQPMFMALGTRRRLLYNDPATVLLGNRHPGALGQPLADAWPTLPNEIEPGLKQAYRGEPAWIDQLRVRTHVGGYPQDKLYSFALSPLRDDGGRVLGAFCTCNEVTRRRTGRDTEARLREAADSLPVIVWVLDTTGQLQLVNHAFCEFFGVDRAELLGTRWTDRIHPDEAKHFLDDLYDCVRARRAFTAQTRVRRADGEWRWIECWARPSFGATAKLRGFVGTSADITDRKRAEAALHEEKQRFQTLADNIAQLAWMADADGRIFWYNRRWLDYTGQSSDSPPITAWRNAQHPEHIDRVVAKVTRCFANGEPWEDTFPLRGKDGEYRWFLSRALPIHDDHGNVVRWIGTNTDVTEQRAYAERLREAERQTSEFLAMLGHELRNPLAAVRSAAELVNLTEPHDHRLHRAWVVLERQSLHMTRLIDSLLEVSRIARGKVKLDRKVVDLAKILDDMLQDRSAQIGASGLDLDRQLPARPLWVLGDDVRLAQIFDNLLGNAIKFTAPPGRITVAARADGDAVVARVRDTGAGIRPEMLTSIFEPFQQETQELSRTAGGLGLGLALAKGLTELHGGSIEARSDGPGEGAEFIVRLPAAQPPSVEPSAEVRRDAGGQRILIVEDNVDAAEMLQFVLEIQGHEVMVAANGAEALELLRHEDMDVVLCDIGLPVMSGYELAREIRSDSALCDLVLIALTGYGRSSDRRRTQEAGFDAHLTKPVELRALDEVLNKLLPPAP
jgi:PAS domain S-box-containing protein